MKKRIGYFLGAISFCWLLVVGGMEFPEPFFKNALIVSEAVVVGIGGLIFSVCLIRG